MAAKSDFGGHASGRKRTLFATVLSALLLIGLPVTGAVGGAFGSGWVAAELTTPEPAPEQEGDDNREKKCGMFGIVLFADRAFSVVLAFIVGGVAGAALGLALAFPTVNTLSEWSVRNLLADAEDDG